MLGFHIDMNMAQFTRGYLEQWLRKLAQLGYDTIIWEVENNIKWETCPECALPDAFTKAEFREILGLCRSLGLEPIPLLQTIGHCEYVLKHSKYAHMAEVEASKKQYCPSKPQVQEFLAGWINEYLEVFGPVKLFHLGADEARQLGKCPVCSDAVAKNGVAWLYVEHVNRVAKPLLDKGITPIIWADMVLSHPESTQSLSRKIMLFDWMYDIYRGNGRVFVWGKDFYDKTTLEPETMEVFGKYLFPHGDELGREPEIFYTADYLLDNGFEVVTCPSSSSYGDNVFSPRHWYHLANTFDSVKKGMSRGYSGAVLTSWTVHLFPWELQQACIDLAGKLKAGSELRIEELYRTFLKEQFGDSADQMAKVFSLLSRSCFLSYTDSLGYDKSCRPVSEDYVFTQLAKFKTQSVLEDELANSKARHKEYQKALDLIHNIKRVRNDELVDFWLIAAENLVNRAQCSCLIIEKELGIMVFDPTPVLNQLIHLRTRTTDVYRCIMKPSRCREIISWMYDPVEYAMNSLVNKTTL